MLSPEWGYLITSAPLCRGKILRIAANNILYDVGDYIGKMLEKYPQWCYNHLNKRCV